MQDLSCRAGDEHEDGRSVVSSPGPKTFKVWAMGNDAMTIAGTGQNGFQDVMAFKCHCTVTV